MAAAFFPTLTRIVSLASGLAGSQILDLKDQLSMVTLIDFRPAKHVTMADAGVQCLLLEQTVHQTVVTANVVSAIKCFGSWPFITIVEHAAGLRMFHSTALLG